MSHRSISVAPRPPIEPGVRVEIRNLINRKDLNNKEGVILEPLNEETGRVAVKVFLNPYSENVRIRPINFITKYDTVDSNLYEPGTCPICLDEGLNAVTGPKQNAVTMVCCGKEICIPCAEQLYDGPNPDTCPCCRADTSDTSDEATVRHIRKRAERGEARAAFNLAVFYDTGDMGLSKDEAEARKWYAVAAPHHPAAAQNLAISHRDGLGGPVDYGKAAEYFQMAVDQNDSQAYGWFGDLYIQGGPGLPANIDKARTLWERGAELGESKSKASLQGLQN